MNWKLKRFETLELKELYEILRVRSEVFVVEQTCIYQDVDLKDFHAFHLFGEKDGEICAYLRILDHGISYPEVSIGRVLTKETVRHQGYAREMMEYAIDYIRKTLNETCIRISAQKYLQEFYESLGFCACSEVYLEDDIPHIEMVWKN